MADWSMLPFDLLNEIALKIEFPEDLVHFSAVCHSWHSIYSFVKKKWTMRMPWLMLPESTTGNPENTRKLFCPENKKCYQLKLPETCGARCWGTSFGWVAAFNLSHELYLCNPFTRVQVSLPHHSTMPLQPKGFNGSHEKQRTCFLDKVCVFNNGHHDDDDDFLIIIMFAGYEGQIAYARPSDQAWASIITPSVVTRPNIKYGVDVARYGSQILILYNDGAIGCCELSAFRNSQCLTVMEYLPPPSELLEAVRDGIHRLYLLESFGDLLMILRYKIEVDDPNGGNDWDKDVCYETIDMEVYKVNFDTKSWTQVKDLGDVSLFVGNNCSMSIRGPDTNNFKRNCIYYTDDEWQFWGAPTCYGGHDMGIFRMDDEEIYRVYEGNDIRSEFCPALWFMPKF